MDRGPEIAELRSQLLDLEDKLVKVREDRDYYRRSLEEVADRIKDDMPGLFKLIKKKIAE
jgi:molecular chaperone GrpE (heat shock protein)